MVDKEYVLAYLEGKNPCFRNGETIPLEITEILQNHYRDKRLESLFLVEQLENPVSKSKIYSKFNIEYRCPSCGEIHLKKDVSRTYILQEMCSDSHEEYDESHIVRFRYKGAKQCENCEKQLAIRQNEERLREEKERIRKEKEDRLAEEKKRQENIRLLWMPLQEYLLPYEQDVNQSDDDTSLSCDDEENFNAMKTVLSLSLQNDDCLKKFTEAVESDRDMFQKSTFYHLCIAHYSSCTPQRCIITGRKNNLELFYYGDTSRMMTNPSGYHFVNRDILKEHPAGKIYELIKNVCSINNAKLSNNHVHFLDEVCQMAKHKGELYEDIAEEDFPYLVWCRENIRGFDVLDYDSNSIFSY